MALFYAPDHARVGDVIPFYDAGQFKPFYLKNWNPYFGQDVRHGWHMLVTDDHLHFRETPTGICGGTGSVIKVGDVYHMFYCIFEQNPQRQYVCHATSADLASWTEHPEHTFGPDECIYLPTDWRDPHVLYSEEEGCWWMLLCAQAQGPTLRRGCVGLCTSHDLVHWTCKEPLYAPMECQSAYECPDMFKMGDWYYLTFSQFTDRFQTIYRMGRSPRGPWMRPRLDSFDARPFYAAKSGSDGVRRFLYGWNPTKVRNSWRFNPRRYEGYDYNTWDWGGSMVVHELWQKPDGTLRVKPIPELISALTTPNEIKWLPLNGEWTLSGDGLTVDAVDGYCCAMTENDVPNECRFEGRFRYEKGTKLIALALQVDEAFSRGYYFCFEPNRNRVQFKGPVRMQEGGWTFPYDVELERPLELEPDTDYQVRVIVDGTIVILYVNDELALSTRAYDLHDRKFGLAVADGAARFLDVRLWTR